MKKRKPKVPKRRNPVAKAVKKLRPKVRPDKRKQNLMQHLVKQSQELGAYEEGWKNPMTEV